MATSPTQRALAECKRRGFTAQVVEHTVPRVFIKRDLFGVIDIVALTPDGILGIQATSGSNHASRREKILAEPRARRWLECGGRLEVWTFAKRGERGKRKLWALRDESIGLGMFEPAAPTLLGVPVASVSTESPSAAAPEQLELITPAPRGNGED